MRCESERQNVVDTLQTLSRTNLVIGTAGNVSQRTADGVLVVSPSALSYEQMTAADVCVVDLDGHPLEGGRDPSSELQLHLAAYAVTDAHAVVHTHSKAAVAVSTLCQQLPTHHYYINQLGGHVAVADYHTFGTRALADAVATALTGSLAALMSNHGAVTIGSDLSEALYRASLLEWLCETWLLARSAGTPRLLTPVELADAQQRRNRNVYEEISHPAP